MNEPKVRRVIADTVKLARERWPAMIDSAALPAPWKKRLRQRLAEHPLLQGLARRGA